MSETPRNKKGATIADCLLLKQAVQILSRSYLNNLSLGECYQLRAKAAAQATALLRASLVRSGYVIEDQGEEEIVSQLKTTRQAMI